MSSNNCLNYTNDVKKLKLLDEAVQNLIREATEARENAYCPYSKFKVGCAVLCEDGTIFAGCNIENASFIVGVCAEKCAYSKAISCGKLKFKAVAVVAYQKNSFATPCGACRQFISEFGDVDVYISKPGHDEVLVLDLKKLLPYKFETVNHTFT
ncbi:cytidine deaminase-like [Euwallacea similis]|uniref:cytidine deaminase-like n=1 Tax=Euwallacea similis TaxID=1736056 RepID=UPI00344DCC06